MKSWEVKYNAPTLLYNSIGFPTHLLYTMLSNPASHETVWLVYNQHGCLEAWKHGPLTTVFFRMVFTGELLRANEFYPYVGPPVERASVDIRRIVPTAEVLHAVMHDQPVPCNVHAKTIFSDLMSNHVFISNLFKDMELETPLSFFDDTLQTCARGHTFSLYHQLCQGCCDKVVCTSEGCDQEIPIRVLQHVKDLLSPTLHPFLIPKTPSINNPASASSSSMAIDGEGDLY